MGNCVSFAPEGLPKCKTCGKEGIKEYGQMTSGERALWIWTADSCECKACNVKAQMEKIKYEKERAYYSKAKAQLYPRPEKQETLRRIHSNEAWQGTASFYQSLRLPSALANLVPFMGPGQRKGTGFVGDSKDSNTNNDGAASPSGSDHAAQLEQLDEELEAVEEESLGDDISDHDISVHSGTSSPHAITAAA